MSESGTFPGTGDFEMSAAEGQGSDGLAADRGGWWDMDILWTALGQEPALERWERRPFWPGVDRGPGPGDRRGAYERTVAVESPGLPEPAGPFRHLAGAVGRFEVFPPLLVTGVLRRRPVEPGDTVGICYHLVWGLDLFFAARVVACFDEPAGDTWRAGFTYRTLVGHPVLGEETFSVEKHLATGRVRAALRSWSRPGILLARALAPALGLFQAHAGRAALDHLGRMARGIPPDGTASAPGSGPLRASAGR
jgi:hypothetical protein